MSASTGPRAPLRGLPTAEQTLPALLERQAHAYGSKPLLRIGGLERSYGEVRSDAAGIAGNLAAAGVAPRERVAMMCENRVELLTLVLGCAWLGAIAVPLNTAGRGPQLAHMLGNSGARYLAIDGALTEVIAHAELPRTLETVWMLDGTGDRIKTSPLPSSTLPSGAEPLRRRLDIGPGDTLAILYTSGTTGPGKGVCCPQAQLYWWGIHTGEALGVEEDDVLYTCLPLFHINALNTFVQALVTGATVHFGPRFSVSRFWDDLRDANATVTYLLGAMVNMLCAQPPSKHGRDHRVRVALAPGTPASVFEAFHQRFGVQLVEAYGSTETNLVIAAPWTAQRAGYMGTVREGFDARVVDELDVEVPPGRAGELVLRSDAPFSFATGYYEMPEQTLEAWRNLWFHTGDRVVQEADGWFRFLDRLKDAIRRRGENISSYEVEQVLLAHAAVAAAAVFPVPSEMAEDEVAAAVVLEPSRTLEPEDLIAHCVPRLAYFAIPRYLEFVGALPLTENGKVRKATLRERGITTTMWDREAAGIRIAGRQR
jgi:crotonobetaine/carnitine-CoA ligase